MNYITVNKTTFGGNADLKKSIVNLAYVLSIEPWNRQNRELAEPGDPKSIIEFSGPLKYEDRHFPITQTVEEIESQLAI